MSRVWYVLKREYLENVRTRAFLIGLILTPVWMGLIFLVPKLVTQQKGELKKVVIVDATGVLGQGFAEPDMAVDDIPVRPDYDRGREPVHPVLLVDTSSETYRSNRQAMLERLHARLAGLHVVMDIPGAGMQTFDQHLLDLYHADVISGTEALRWASNPEALSMGMRGIVAIGAGRKDAG